MEGTFGRKTYEFEDSFGLAKAVLVWEQNDGKLDNDDFEQMLDEHDVHFEILVEGY